MNVFLRFVIITVCLVLVVGGVGLWLLFAPFGDASGPTDFRITVGEDAKTIGRNLSGAGLVRNEMTFEVAVWLLGADRTFVPGSHSIPKRASSFSVVRSLTSSEGKERTIRIIEGWEAGEIATYFEREGVMSADEFLAASSATDSRTIIPGKTYAFLDDKPSTAGLEGYLFPDTYRIFRNATAADIVEKMLDTFEVKYSSLLSKGEFASPPNVFDVARLASIVEAEVRTAEDRPIVAGIFAKRLAIGMPLQSDATVNYVTRKKTTRPSLDDLRVSSPYNTYENRGLPPGPIGNPSLASLKAALFPQESDYLYFLTKPDGTVVYGRTAEEHAANKAKYLP